MADKALLAGINNYKTIGDLRGCVNDTQSIQNLLVDSFNFAPNAVRILTDKKVTKAELRKQWRWLISELHAGDRIVFHFSGHGSYNVDQNADEEDGVDELLCLYGMDWDDPETYLLDDELHTWTQEVPTGVQLTVLLDSCHSGTGTRMVERPGSSNRGVSMQSATLVDLETSLRRLSITSKAAMSNFNAVSRSMSRVLPATTDQLTEQSVVARFAQPPEEVIRRINKVGKRSTFSDAVSSPATAMADRGPEMNHVLWSGSQSDQTSADAWIDGDYHGAFTWHFCDSVRAAGATPRVEKVIKSLRKKLKDAGFSQVPQLEPEGISGILLKASSGHDSADRPSVSTQPVEDTESDCGCGETKKMNGGPTADQWERIATSMELLVQQLSLGQRGDSLRDHQATRGLVYVHGICLHEPGYSRDWWNSLSPHLPSALRNQLASNRPEVLWSRHVTPTDRAVSMSEGMITRSEEQERKAIQEMLTIALEERASFEVSAAMRDSNRDGVATTSRGEAGPPESISRAAFGIPGIDCVDDFSKYLASDRIRAAVIDEFVKVVRPMLAAGQAIDVISHSWGTVVAYEALRSLEAANLPGTVANFFTVGSALAVSLIRKRLRPNDGRKPSMVKRWINLDAKSDFVGGSLRAVDLAVDAEFLDLAPVGCSGFGWPVKLYTPACAHSSYFHTDNHAVNRDIFAAFMQR